MPHLPVQRLLLIFPELECEASVSDPVSCPFFAFGVRTLPGRDRHRDGIPFPTGLASLGGALMDRLLLERKKILKLTAKARRESLHGTVEGHSRAMPRPSSAFPHKMRSFQFQ